MLGGPLWVLHSPDTRVLHRDLYIHRNTTSTAELSNIVKVVHFRCEGRVRKRVAKNGGNRNIEESLRLIFSSSIGGRNLLCVFLMPPIPIDLRYSFLFLSAHTHIKKKVNVGLDGEEFNSVLGRGTVECLRAIGMGTWRENAKLFADSITKDQDLFSCFLNPSLAYWSNILPLPFDLQNDIQWYVQKWGF